MKILQFLVNVQRLLAAGIRSTATLQGTGWKPEKSLCIGRSSFYFVNSETGYVEVCHYITFYITHFA